MDKFVIIDGNSIVNRAFYALPLLSNDKNEYSNAVYGFCNILVKLIKEQNPKYICVAFDFGKPTFRHKLYEQYKGTRKKMPDELASQMPILKRVLTTMGIKIIEKEGIEADDIIGTLSTIKNCEKIIVSGDRDVLQLIDDETKVWFTKKGISNVEIFDQSKLAEVFNILPYQVIELKSLMGDSSDNIPGVLGVGEKTAHDLIEKYKDLDNVYANIDSINGALKQKLVNGKESAYLSKTLATISRDQELDKNLDSFMYQFPFEKATYDIFTQYEFKSLLKREDLFNNIDTIKINSKIDCAIKYIENYEQLNQLISQIQLVKEFSFCIKDNVYISLSKFEQYIIKINQNLFFEGIEIESFFALFKPIFEDENIKKIVFDSKSLKHFLLNFNCSLLGEVFDVTIAEYLVNCGKKVDANVDEFLFASSYNDYCYSSALFNAKFILLKQLQDYDMASLYFDVEMPLCNVLFDMEIDGVKLDTKELNNIKIKFEEELDFLTAKIYEIAGEKFNINSPKQLATVLFDKLALHSPTKNRSTDISVLNSLSHPIIEYLKQYRDYSKILSTYIYAFIDKVSEKNGLLHTIFNQTLTTTGRLSSSEPNLQNIPLRKEEGKQIRKIFISRFENGKLLSADYSQIELRLLAHFSKDDNLIRAFENNEDIHTQTASKVFNIPMNQVNSDYRRKAKAINFGIIYGISEFGLSQNIGSSVKYAKDTIERYFEAYPHVKQFMNSSVELAKEQGFVSTLLGRRRKIDELNSSNYNIRQFGERAAMNMPLQGTASDIIKLAMVKVQKELNAHYLQSKLILQIHDELIVDCKENEVEDVKKIVKNCMENVVQLCIPLTVEIEIGENWLDAK